MADSSGGWTSPSGDGGQGDDRPRYGERVPGWTPPAASAEPEQPRTAVDLQASGSYSPPPRRGLIPLHPLSFGQLLGASFGVIRWNAKATVVPALVISALQSVLTLGGFGLFAVSAIDRVQRASTGTDRDQILAGVIGGGLLITLGAIAITVFSSALLQGMLVTVIARAAVGERITIRQALRAGFRRLLPLLGFAVLIGALQLVAIAVLGGLVVLIASTGQAGIVVAIVVGILGGLAFAAAYLFLAIKLTTVPSTIVLERLGVFASIRRSWTLMRSAFWRTLGLLALVVAMVSVAAQIVTLPFSVLGGALSGLLFPNASGDLDDIVPLLVGTIPGSLVGIVVAGLGQIAQVAAVVLVYLDRRMRREGLDLELQRFVEQGGQDPFEPVG